MKAYVTIGLAVVAGAALLETALIPGILIGGLAVLAPRYLPQGALPSLRRRAEALAAKAAPQGTARDRSRRLPSNGAPKGILPKSPSDRRLPRPSPSGSSSPASTSA
jgi:hypothetical protein